MPTILLRLFFPVHTLALPQPRRVFVLRPVGTCVRYALLLTNFVPAKLFFCTCPGKEGGLQKRTAPASAKKTWPERLFVPAATNISASFTVSTTVRYIGFFLFTSFLFGGRAATVTATVCCVSEEGIPLSKVALGVSRPT